jgi:hypothetical protein
MVKCSNISNGASLWNSPWIEIWRWCYPGGGGKNSPLPPSLAPCKRRWIVDWRFPPYPGDEGSLWNDELKRVDLFLPLWKQFLLIFICLVQLSISSSALLSAPLYLGWWWAAPASTQGCVAVTVRPCYWCKRGWLNWCCPKFPLCLQPWTWPSNVSFWFWQFPIVIREITLGGNWMKDTQQLSWLFSFSTSCFAVRIRLVKLWFFILPLGVTSDYLHSLSKLPIYKMKIMMEAVECIEGVTFIQHLGQ